jgi:FMN phosphatase YigB (HAD superfamily)
MNTFLFDLDGTLLPMPSLNEFTKVYFKNLSDKLASYGFNCQNVLQALMLGMQKMVANDGTITNEERFWEEFCKVVGTEAKKMEHVFIDFYENEFEDTKRTTSTNPLANKCIKRLKSKGYHAVLATNPLFPKIATMSRIRWAGLDADDFDLVTTYENSSYCKPNLDYYNEILSNIGKKPKDCIMVGNDITEDMCTSSLGMDTFLLKDCLICPEGEDISGYRQGGFEDLYYFIDKMPQLNS